MHYTRAAHKLGLWHSEQAVFAEHLPPDHQAHILEAGCGAGRVSLGLWELGYRNRSAFDFAEELCAMAQSLFLERATGDAITLFHADSRKISQSNHIGYKRFDAALFMFNGLMQIPRRRNRRSAMRSLRAVCKPGAPFIFTPHDRDHSKHEKKAWRYEAKQWAAGKQDPCLVEFGDRYFEDDLGRTCTCPTGRKSSPISKPPAGRTLGTPCGARSPKNRVPSKNSRTNAASGSQQSHGVISPGHSHFPSHEESPLLQPIEPASILARVPEAPSGINRWPNRLSVFRFEISVSPVKNSTRLQP